MGILCTPENEIFFQQENAENKLGDCHFSTVAKLKWKMRAH